MNILQKTIHFFTSVKTKENPLFPMTLRIENYKGGPNYFGYKSCWYAIKTSKTQELADFIVNVECNLTASLMFEDIGRMVFVSSNYNGWTFLICESPTSDSIKGCSSVKRVLSEISSQFDEAQFFGTHRVVEYHSWGKAVNGQLERLYSYLGEIGENLCVEGLPTKIEESYNLENTFKNLIRDDNYYDQNDITFPEESIVMAIAESWSFNPTKFSKKDFEDIWTNALVIERVK